MKKIKKSLVPTKSSNCNCGSTGSYTKKLNGCNCKELSKLTLGGCGCGGKCGKSHKNINSYPKGFDNYYVQQKVRIGPDEPITLPFGQLVSIFQLYSETFAANPNNFGGNSQLGTETLSGGTGGGCFSCGQPGCCGNYNYGCIGGCCIVTDFSCYLHDMACLYYNCQPWWCGAGDCRNNM